MHTTKNIIVAGIVAVSMIAGTGMAGEQQQVVADRLYQKLLALPYVDSHSHVPGPNALADTLKEGKYDVVRLLGSSTYVSEFTSGSTWEEVRENLKTNWANTYYRPILESFHDLYGLKPGEELNDQNWKQVSERMDTAHRQEGWFTEVLRKRAGLTHILWPNGEKQGQAEMPLPWIHSVWNIDGFVFIGGYDEKKKEWSIDRFEKDYGKKVRTLGAMEKLVDSEIDSYFARGGASLKSTAAYYRSLDFDDTVPRGKAESVFRKVASHKKASDPEGRLLENYLMTRVLTALSRNKKPIQFHTGNQQSWNTVANSNPLGLNRLLVTGRWWDVKFVVLHGGYPYTREAITMTRYFENCYLDLAWMVLFSPDAAENAMGEALDIIPAGRLMMGTDTANLEEMYGTIKFTRRALANALAKKVANGYLTEEVALDSARRVLAGNAMKLYGLKD